MSDTVWLLLVGKVEADNTDGRATRARVGACACAYAHDAPARASAGGIPFYHKYYQYINMAIL